MRNKNKKWTNTKRKDVKNELKDIVNKLGSLNNSLEQVQDENTRNRTLEAREEFQLKYRNLLKKEAN